MTRRRAFVAGLTLALALVAWVTARSWAPRSEARPTTPADEPQTSLRVVSLAPAVTETLEALGVGSRLVGLSDYCSGRPELPRVGTVFTPRFEAIATARPTLIVTTHVGGVQWEPLTRLAPTVALPWLTVAEVASSVRRLGQLTSSGDRAEALASRFERELSRSAPENAPRVLLLLDDASGAGGFWYIKQNSLHGALLGAAGARNARPEPTEAAPRLSVEELLGVDPDAIVVLGAEARPGPPAIGPVLLRLEPLRAVRGGRLARLADPRLLGSGPGLLDFVEPLREAIGRASRGESWAK